MNPTLATILGIVGTAAATAIATALAVFGPLLAGILKLWGLTTISKLAVHSVEQDAKVKAKLGVSMSDDERRQLAATRVAQLTKWCGLADSTDVVSIPNQAHVLTLPATNPIPTPQTTVNNMSFAVPPVTMNIGTPPISENGTVPKG